MRLFYLLLVALTGCAAAGTLPRLSGSTENSLVAGKGDFVELLDGTMIEGVISMPVEKVVVINGVEYNKKSIKSYQTKKEYRTTVKNWFVTRCVKGKLNLYYHDVEHEYNPTSKSGGHTVRHYYLQKGDNGKLEFFDVKKLEAMVKENQKASEWIEKFKQLKKKDFNYLDNAIAAYNN